ncbi:MAG: hypothetical protein VX589_01680 [Myxococcota bacterium]|nr:hypothetical protein [Myxococcota bacterium]
MKGLLNPVLFWFVIAAVCGCADPVEDIDRTQPNLIRKADLEGEWYMMQTVTHVPPAAWFTFVGETSMTERIRWDIQENILVAYRSYPYIRGAESPTLNEPFDGKENPVAAYPIISHVDVRREYNSSTGEQSNVIIENDFDRPWFERDYVRVDWSQSSITNFEFIAPAEAITDGAYFVPEERGIADPEYRNAAVYRENDTTGVMNYFDVLGRLFVVPDEEWGCFWVTGIVATDDCTASEVGIRSSFSRVPETNDYEAYHYDDQLLSRFGYYRSEYLTYDEQRGITDMARKYMLNRHNIWAQTKDGDQTIPIPERALRTVPYYLSAPWPDDPLIERAAFEAVRQWNDALRIGLDAAGVLDKSDVFVLCHNPVADGDHKACGEVGFSPRVGDLRYSSLHWVDGMNLQNPLGYGPSAVDPITGEIISGKAYVYGAEISQWATRAVDMVRYLNEDLELNQLVTGQHFISDVWTRLGRIDTVDRHSRQLDERPLRQMTSRPRKSNRTRRRVKELKGYDRQATIRRAETAREAGLSPHRGNAEVMKATRRARQMGGMRTLPLADDRDEAPSLNTLAMRKRAHFHRHARQNRVDMNDMLVPNIEGLLRAYRGRNDYELMWQEIRAEIFAATTEHELGHTFGLRHNFQGSYDSLNYPDEYWRLREENLFAAQSLGDIYRLSTLTEAQHNGQMRQMQYSSIMDYGYNWQNDLNGLGKYDRAAIIFGYTAGTYRGVGPVCQLFNGISQSEGCVVQLPGLVEVFAKRRAALGQAGQILDRRESGFSYDDSGLPSINVLERFHYTTLALAFPSLQDLSDAGRQWVNYGEYTASKTSNDRLIKVPYLFCSDEWSGGLVSCHPFDQGADPFEIARTYAQHYRAYYPFDNFRMDDPFFDIATPYFNYLWRLFVPLSDIFQSWYVAPWGYDDLFDRTYEMATQVGFNLFAEVLATPEYGDYCENESGRLIHLGNDPFLQGEPPRAPECIANGPKFTLLPGEGRRQFSIFDPASGYYFPDKPLEAGHYWATLAAIEALTDPEAYILGVDGDAGTYAISYLDWFTEEFTALMNNLLSSNYGVFAPVAAPDGAVGPTGQPTVRLRYQPPSVIIDDFTGAAFDPETGRSTDRYSGPLSVCEVCTANEQCVGYNGRSGGVFCEQLFEDDDSYCIKDCMLDANSCPAGTYCDAGSCYPNNDDCSAAVSPCSANNPFGQCPDGLCINGTCTPVDEEHLVQAESSFSTLTDAVWYSFLMSTASFSTRFNDQMNIFRPGTPSEVDVVDSSDAERYTFTSPVTGVSYAAVQANCPSDPISVQPGSISICGGCSADDDCAGYTGYVNDVFCQPLSAGSDAFYCLRDCSEDATICGADEVCNVEGNCIPANGLCPGGNRCSPQNPNGPCDHGNVCYNGACVTEECAAGFVNDTGAVLMVKRGQALADRYVEALNAWYRFVGDESAEDALLQRAENLKFELQNHTDLIETILATYTLFGRIY